MSESLKLISGMVSGITVHAGEEELVRSGGQQAVTVGAAAGLALEGMAGSAAAGLASSSGGDSVQFFYCKLGNQMVQGRFSKVTFNEGDVLDMVISSRRNGWPLVLAARRSNDRVLWMPEAHGIMLYQLTRHGNMTWAQIDNKGWSFESLGERKKAVLQVCKWAQTKRQFENIVQHISPSGAKGGFKGNLDGLLRFMEIGPFDSKYDDELRALYGRLPIEPARGWPVALNDSVAFKTNLRMSDSLTYLAQLQGKSIGGNLA